MFKAKWVAIGLSLMLSVALIAGCGKPAGKSDDTVKIGFLGALTGNHASYGTETLKGMKMAAEELNKAGGVLGKKVVIVEADNRSDKAEGANVTQKFITRDKVAAIVGDPTTGITKVAAPIAQQNKVVLLSAGAVGPGVVETGDYIFRNTLIDAVAAPTVTKYAIETMGWKKIAVVTSINNDYSVGLTKLFKDAIVKYGGQIVVEETIQDGDQNFSAQITNLKKHNPDGIIFTGYYTEGGLLMKEARKQGMMVKMLGGDGLQSPVLWELGGDAVEGSMTYAGFAVDPVYSSPETKKFVELYQRENGGKLPDLFSAQGYDAVMLIAEAIKKANSAEPSKFREVLAKTRDYPGVSGKTTFRENREPLKSPVFLLEVKNKSFVVKTAIPVAQ